MKQLVLVLCMTLGLPAGVASAPRDRIQGEGEGLKPVAAVAYDNGTHLALTSWRGRDFAFAAQAALDNQPGMLRSIDITDPTRPRVVDTLACGFNQGYLDISHDRRTLMMGADVTGPAGEECLGLGQPGFMTIDISNPTRLRALGFASIARGSHGATAHPDEPLVYNSYGDVFATDVAEFEIWSIKDPADPKLLEVVPVPGYHGPHDMTFSPDGGLMVASNVSTLQVFDTSDPRNPVLLSTLQCPGCQHTHESRFTPDGKRLIVTDETMGSPNPCPGGGLYFYEVAQDGTLTFTGAYQTDDAVIPAGRAAPTFCTSHVIGVSLDGKKVAASWHGAGLRLLDITHTDGITIGDEITTGRGPKQLGWFVAEDSDAMSAKLYKGPYLYSNDLNRGFEVFRFGRKPG